LMLGGSTAVMAQQGREGGGGRPDAPGQSQAAPPGQAAPGRDQGRPAAREAQPSETKGVGDRRAQEKQGERDRSEGKQPRDRDRQAQDKKKQDRDRDRQAQDKQKQDRDRDRQAQDKQKQDRDRDRQAQDKQKQDRDRDRQTQDKQKQDRDRQAQDKQSPTKGDRQDRASGPSDDNARAGRVDLSENQRERVRREFREHRQREKVRHYTNVDVDISVGRRAPRNWNYYPVPSFIIDIEPRYRGYRYVWVEDRYYIVDPATYVIVGYVDDGSGYVYASGGRVGSSATGRGGGEVGRAGRCEVSLNEAERSRIIAEIDDWSPRPLPVPEIRVGIDLPAELELRIFPEPLRTSFRELEGCRYIPVAGNRLLIVEADTRRVVAIVER